MLNPDVVLFGFSVSEPITTLTDLITAGVCLVAYRKLRNRSERVDRETFLWGEFFFYMGVATLLSGLFGHALRSRVPDGVRMVAWSFSGVAVLFAERATIEPLARTRLVAALPWIQLTLFLGVLWYSRDFAVVVQNLIIGLIVYVTPFQIRLIRNGNSPGPRRAIVLGIAAGLVPAVVFSRELAVSRWFNHHDISHLLTAGVSFLLYRGVAARADETLSPPTYERSRPLRTR